MGEKKFDKHGGGGGTLPTPCNFLTCQCTATKFGIVIELCKFYPKIKELVLLIYANELYDFILLFWSLKRYRNSNHCKIVIFKFITLKFAMWVDKR